MRRADDPDSSPTVVLHAHADADGNPGDHSHYKDDAKNDPGYRCASARGMEICSQSQLNNVYKNNKFFPQEWPHLNRKSAYRLLKMLQILTH